MNRYDWHPWFAWYPVRESRPWDEDRMLFWLRWVECRIVGAVAPDGDLTEYWEYRQPRR